MQSFEIGLSGLDAARKSLDTIGNNIANAATEGYHRQRTELAPAKPISDGRLSLGSGVEVLAISRAIETFVEAELINQNGLSFQLHEELSTLRTVESTFGELSGSGSLSQAIGKFFNALQDLAAHPSEAIYQRQLITSAQTMTSQFQSIGASLDDMAVRVGSLIDATVAEISELAEAIATLNQQIQKSEASGSAANNLRDQRDQQITELSKLVGVQTRERENGMVDVTVGGISLVIGSDVTEIETGYLDSDALGIGVVGSDLYRTVEGGALGGLLSVKNDLLIDIHGEFDTLAATFIRQFNEIHVQGVGSDGSFSDLTGWNVDSDTPLEDLGLDITSGTLYIRVINTNTGAVHRVEVTVDAATDTLQALAAQIDAGTGLNASVLSGRLHIGADAGYEFDFLPAPLPEPDTTDFDTPSEAPDIAVSGIYTGDANDVLTFTVQGGGSVGNGDWSIVVTNQDGDPVTSLDLGGDYVSGQALDLGNGIRISLGVGALSDGDSFTVEALIDSDTGSVLAALGLNTFFLGNSADSMAVASGFDDNPGRVATSLGSDFADNENVKRMTDLRDEALADLGERTVEDYYNNLVTTLGQDITTKKNRQSNIEAMLQNLEARQSEASGVDINDEAAKILMFEQMYQAMAKYMNTVRTSTETLMTLVG